MLVCAHAPHSFAEEHEIRAFWTTLHDALQPYRHLPILAGLDANGRCGSELSMHVGDADPEVENPGGAFLRDFMRSLSLWAINTFRDVSWQTDVGVDLEIQR